MSHKNNFLILIFAFFVFNSKPALSEPWVSNRFAQNCSACHSPSRRNLPVGQQRCTLSCQGCHVNPSGGGLRNFYGKWNEKKWLRSNKKWGIGDRAPAPLTKQHYGKQPKKLKKKHLKNYLRGPKLVESKVINPNEKKYDRSDKQEFITVRSRKEFLTRITKNDPYRLSRSKYFLIGGDFRYFYISQSGDNVSAERKTMAWPMSLDIGTRIRPLLKWTHKASIVYEGRFLNKPKGSFGDLIGNEFKTRSAYLLWDDLPYASYVMAGLYRPMFNYYNPDHENLAQIVTGLSTRTKFKAISFGASPNVPFFNFHIISPENETVVNQEKGMVINLGGRFVKQSLSLRLSYWKTTLPNDLGIEVNKDMISFTAGFMFKRLIFNFDTVHVSKEFLPGVKDAGFVNTADVKFKLYKENYLNIVSSAAIMSKNLNQGSSYDLGVGIKSFVLAGLELEFMYTIRENLENSVKTKRNLAHLQIHSYF